MTLPGVKLQHSDLIPNDQIPMDLISSRYKNDQSSTNRKKVKSTRDPGIKSLGIQPDTIPSPVANVIKLFTAVIYEFW